MTRSTTGRARALLLTAAVLTGIVTIALRSYQLDSRQLDLYGDLVIVARYIENISMGEWPFFYDVSAGPLYHYLVAPLVLAFGPGAFGLKAASALVSLGVVIFTGLFVRDLADDAWAGVVAAWIAGVGSWLLIFSRLGNSQILVPLLCIGSAWLLLRYARHGRRAALIGAAVVAGLGLYVYPQTFILPGVLGMMLVAVHIWVRPVPWQHYLWLIGTTLLLAIPFSTIVARDPANFFSGYIGGKLQSDRDPVPVLLENLRRGALALHVRGDRSFRGNIENQPHLDLISGVLLLLGIGALCTARYRRLAPLVLLPLVLTQIPSLLVLEVPEDVPSASRTLGAAPFVYALAGLGLVWPLRTLAARTHAAAALTLGALLLVPLTWINIDRVFVQYPKGMPYGDTPVNALLAQYVDALPPETPVYMAGCCWESSKPDIESTGFALRVKRVFQELDATTLTCDRLRLPVRPARLVWSFNDRLPNPTLADCDALGPPQRIDSPDGKPLFNTAALIGESLNVKLEGLRYTTARYGTTPLGVMHSPFDMGSAPDLVDNDDTTLVRGAGVNPLIIELRFDAPQPVSAVSLTLGLLRKVRVALRIDGATTPLATQDFGDLPPDPTVRLDLPAATGARVIRLTLTDLAAPAGGKVFIHVREVRLVP